MRIIKAIIGNYISRITFGTVNSLVDEEWDAEQLKKPSRKSWFYFLIVFPLVLICMMTLLYFLFN